MSIQGGEPFMKNENINTGMVNIDSEGKTPVQKTAWEREIRFTACLQTQCTDRNIKLGITVD